MIAGNRAALVEQASTVSDALIHEFVSLHLIPLDKDASVVETKVAQALLLG